MPNEEMHRVDEGVDFLLDFWVQKYLKEYIYEGGSKVKFVTGRKGSGKTWFLQQFTDKAEELGYVTVSFSANDVWLSDFTSIYLGILDQCDLNDIVHRCSMEIVRRMGYEPESIPEGQTFEDYLSSIGQLDILTEKKLRNEIRRMFLSNPKLDNNFAVAFTLMAGDALGYVPLEAASREILLGWLHADKTIKFTLLREVGLAPVRINRYNARHMLRSLSEVIRLGGQPGIVVTIDDLDILQNKEGNGVIRYTKMRRDDTYEGIRQLIDDIDTMKGLMFVYGFDRILLDNETAGIKSYQALWMRIENEVHGARFNRFADIADMDELAYQEYTPEYLVEMSGGLITADDAEKILKDSHTGSTGIPGLVMQKAEGGEEEDNGGL